MNKELRKIAFFFCQLLLALQTSAQQSHYIDDSSFRKKIKYSVSQLGNPANPSIDYERKRALRHLIATGDTLIGKYEFLVNIVNASFWGGGKSGQELKNRTLNPFLTSKRTLIDGLNSIGEPSISLIERHFKSINQTLDSLYLKSFRNQYYATDVTGDDDSIIMVEVSVRVYESFAGKKEIGGYSVYSYNPFLKDSKEDFAPTTNAIRIISPGWKEFYIKKGKNEQHKIWHVVLMDEHTHLVPFREQK